MRLGVYTDLVFYGYHGELTTDRAYVRFVLGLADRVDELVVLGRRAPGEQRRPYVVCPSPRVRCVELPYYASLSHGARVAAGAHAAVRAFAAACATLDGVWLFGPHPLSLAFAAAARRRGVPVALCVRQELPEYVGRRVTGVRRPAALAAATGLELVFRLLARRLPTVVVGERLAAAFTGGPAPVLSLTFSQMTDADVARRAPERSWDEPLRILSVGRLDPEKNPLLLPEILALVRREEPRWTLEVVGEGPLRADVERRAAELGVSDAVSFAGYVPAGPELWERYRRSHAFLHVSHTEGVPSVVVEAHAAGLPVVATDVGGVRSAVGDGGLLVPTDDAAAAAVALERLRGDAVLRNRLVAAGRRLAATRTREAELDRLSSFLHASLGAPPSSAR